MFTFFPVDIHHLLGLVWLETLGVLCLGSVHCSCLSVCFYIIDAFNVGGQLERDTPTILFVGCLTLMDECLCSCKIRTGIIFKGCCDAQPDGEYMQVKINCQRRCSQDMTVTLI